MNDQKQVLSRLSADEFFDREAELERIHRLAQQPGSATSVLVIGPPRAGKSELLRKSFDRLFHERMAVVPLYYAFRGDLLNRSAFAQDCLAQFLAQLVAFRRSDPQLMTLGEEPLDGLLRYAPTEDYPWIKTTLDRFNRAAQSADPSTLVRCALSFPTYVACNARLIPLVMLDDFHLVAETGRDTSALRSEIIRMLIERRRLARAASVPNYVLCGLRRQMLEAIPPEEEFFDALELIQVEPMSEQLLELLIERLAAKLGVEMSEGATELMIQQTGRDLFYTRALLVAAASRRCNLKSFMEFERVYTEEVLNGRIGHYLDVLLGEIAHRLGLKRMALEVLAFIFEAGADVPLESVYERVGGRTAEAESLLARMHVRELLELNFEFVSPAPCPVLADYVRARYRSHVIRARRPIAGHELLGEKLKQSYRLMMSRYNRAVESQLVRVLSQFDFQSVPASLFDHALFKELYGNLGRACIRRALDEEQQRIRLPQIVMVSDLGASEQPAVSWRLFAAYGFEGGIYSEANEVIWQIALINSKDPIDIELLDYIDQRLESALRSSRQPQSQVRWYISKEGFSSSIAQRFSRMRAYHSTYAQLDLLYDFLAKHPSQETATSAATCFELVIPMEDDSELIAARTVEQIARTADFDQEAINQIKTALIEACLNAAEHSDSPDRRIYQRFELGQDRLTITVYNKGKIFGPVGEEIAAVAGSAKRGRGLQIIRSLMDEVRFERTEDGASLVMTKFIKRPEKQS
jgi:serine/threonine-protein kinase RsbW